MKHIYFFLAALFITVQAFAQTTRYVDASAGGNNDGTSWANAYISLQSALDAASSGDEIWAAKGTYKPSSAYDLTNTSRFYHFRMINGVAIYGGFAGTETAVTQRTNYGVGETNETILSGDIGTIDDNSDNCYHIFYHPSGIDATAILDGFTITKGNANGSNPHDDGGGMYNSSSSPTINNTTFKSNSANDVGGGISNNSSSPVITNSLFVLNTASYGAGVNLSFSSPTFNNTTFTLNSASVNGGGIRKTSNASPNINNCIIWGNTANSGGNQIFNNGIGAFTLNYSCYANGTGDVGGNTAITATNNNITSDPQFVDSDNGDYRIIGNSPAAEAGNNSYNSQTYDIRGNGFDRKLDKTDGSAGTIDMGAYEYKFSNDPLPVELISFTAAIKNGTVEVNWQTATEVNNYGFEIQRSAVSDQPSAWVKIGFVPGAGNSNSPKSYTFTDQPIGGTTFSYRLKQIDNDGKYKIYDAITVNLTTETKAELMDNYPNPFNPSTAIKFYIPNNSDVSIKIYDMLGSEVMTLLNNQSEAGYHIVYWNGMDSFGNQAASGVYLYRLTANPSTSTSTSSVQSSATVFTETKKMLLMK